MPLYRFRARALLTILCITLLTIVLAACGSDQATTAAQPTATPTATHAATPTPSPTHAATPTPTLALQPTATSTPTPAPMTPAILDVRPSSMSIVGHLDCQQKMAYICLARVLSRASNQGNLSWTSFTDIPGNVLFAPANGTLTPGQSTLITITIPLNDCKTGLFYFKGPANTHTISWVC